VLIVRVDETGPELEIDVGLKLKFAPVGRPEVMVKLALHAVPVPLKVPVTLYVAEAPGATVVGLCAPTAMFPSLIESVNVFCACTPDWLPTTLRKKRTFRSWESVVKLLSEIFPFASAVTVYGPCVSISGNSTSVIATDSPGLKPLL